MAAFFWGDNGEALSQEDLKRRQEMADALVSGQGDQPVRSWTQAIGNTLNHWLGAWQNHDYEQQRADNDQRSQAIANALMSGDGAFGGAGADVNRPMTSPYAGSAQAMAAGGYDGSAGNPFGDADGGMSPVAQALAQSGQASAAPGAKQGAIDLISQSLLDHMRQAESGGDNNAVNPRSSATGAFQFTDPTWTGMMRQHPELGLTAGGRADPQQSEAAAKQLATDNIAYLLAHGVQNPTEGDVYLAHFAGPAAAARAANADPSSSIASILSQQQIAANPNVQGMTAGGLRDWATGKMGGPTQQITEQPQPLGQPQGAPMGFGPPTAGMPSMGALASVLSDPRINDQTKSLAGTLMGNQLQMRLLAQQEQLRQSDPLYQSEINERNMQAQALQQRMNAPQKQTGYTLLPPNQAQAMGLDPKKAYQVGPDGKIGEIGNSGVNVTLNNGPTTSEFQKKSDDAAADRLGGYVAEGNAAPAMIGQLQQLSDLSRSIGTGKGAQFTAAVGPYAQALGINVKGLDETQAFTAIVDRMAPQMRPVGSGSSSDTDVRMFMNSLPRLSNTDRGNQIITSTMQALQQNKVQAADIASQAQRGQISWQDAESQIRSLPNPYEQFKKAHADLASSPSSGARTTSTGVIWSVR